MPKYRALFFKRTSLEMFFYLKNLSFGMRSFGLEKPPDLALDSVDPPFPYFFLMHTYSYVFMKYKEIF